MSTSKGEPPGSSSGPIEELTTRIFRVPRVDWLLETERLCAQYPQYGDELRTRIQLALELGLAGSDDIVEPTIPEAFDGFRLVRRLGRGGMGLVYLAEQQTPSRLVALKLIRDGAFAGQIATQRFRRELEAAGRLNHPGLCTLLSTGEVAGMPYLVMQYVPGQDLERLLAERAPHSGEDRGVTTSTQDAMAADLELLEQTASAVHAAHEAGVVHRDLKPANVILRPDGQPVVLDFGLAQITAASAEAPRLTLSGEQIGTPAYMSPEQLRGERIAAGDRSVDVYGLGVTAYQWLTGRLPFPDRDVETMRHAILAGEATPCCQVNRSLPRDLGVVIHKAIDRDARRRYPTAAEFAEDLRRVRLRLPILARPPGPVLRLRRWCARNPVLAVSLVFLVTGLWWTLIQLGRTEYALEFAEANRLISESAERRHEDPVTAQQLAIEPLAWAVANGEDGVAARARSALYSATVELHVLRVAPIGDVAVQRSLTAGPGGIAVSSPAGHHRFDARGEQLASIAPHELTAFASRTGTWVATESDRRRLVCGTPTGQRTWTEDGDFLAVAIAPDGQLAACLDRERGLLVHSPATAATAMVIDGTSELDVLWPDAHGVRLFAWSDRRRELWVLTDAGHTRFMQRLAKRPDEVRGLPAGRILVQSGDEVQILDERLAPEPLDGERLGLVKSMTVTARGDVLLGNWQRQLWRLRPPIADGRTWTAELVPTGDLGGPALVLAASPGSELVALTGGEPRLQVIDEHGHVLARMAGHPSGALAVAWIDDRHLASVGSDGKLRVWGLDPVAGPLLLGHDNSIRAVATHGPWLATADIDGRVQLYTDDGKLHSQHLERRGASYEMAFAPNGEHLFVAAAEPGILVLQIPDLVCVARLRPSPAARYPKPQVVTVSSPRSGEVVGRCNLDATRLRMLRWRRGEDGRFGPAEELPLPEGYGVRHAWNPDGSRLAVTARAGEISIFEAETWKQDAIAPAAAGAVGIDTLDWLDDRRLAWGLRDGTVRIRDLSNGRDTVSRELHSGAVHSIDLQPGTGRIVTGSSDGSLCVSDPTLAPYLRVEVPAKVLAAGCVDENRVLLAGNDCVGRILDLGPAVGRPTAAAAAASGPRSR